MFCAKCGKKIDDDSTFCPYCGQKINAPEEGKKAVVSGEPKKAGGDVAMSSQNKTSVPHSKKLICAGIFAVLGIILLVIMVFPKNKDTYTYMPGVYTTSIILNDNLVEIEVTVDEKNIKSIRMVHLDEAVIAMFPLIEPAFDELVSQICENQSLDDITYSEDQKYTSMVLLGAIKEAVQKAEEAAGNTGEG